MSELYMKYFVLKPRGEDIYAKASRTAMRAYADVIDDTDPKFAAQLREQTLKETPKIERRTWRCVYCGTRVTHLQGDILGFCPEHGQVSTMHGEISCNSE